MKNSSESSIFIGNQGACCILKNNTKHQLRTFATGQKPPNPSTPPSSFPLPMQAPLFWENTAYYTGQISTFICNRMLTDRPLLKMPESLTLEYLKVSTTYKCTRILAIKPGTRLKNLPTPAKPIFFAFTGGMVEEKSEVEYIQISILGNIN